MAQASKIVPVDDLPGDLVPSDDLPADISMTKSASDEPRSKPENSIASSIGAAIEPVTSNPIAQGIAAAIKNSALPMAGQAGGLAVGAALGGPIGAVIGESIGGGVGEMANQLAGITEPSIKEVMIAMAAGPVTRGVIGGMRLAGGSLMKGMAGGDRFKEIAAGIASARLKPPTPASQLFDNASMVSGYIPTYRTSAAIKGILAKERDLPKTDVSKSIIEAVENLEPSFRLSRGAQPALEAQAIATTAQDLRVAATAAYSARNWRLGQALGDIRGALLDDAAASGVPVFKEAAKAARKELAIERLENIFRQPKPLKEFDRAVRNKQDRLFKGSFSSKETEEIRHILTKLEGVAPSGFSGVVGRTITASVGSGAGGPIGMMVGWVAPDIAAYAVGTRAGRNMIEKLLVGGVWDAPRAAALTQFVRAQRAEDAKNDDIAKAVKASLKSSETSIETKLNAARIGAGFGGAQSFIGALR